MNKYDKIIELVFHKNHHEGEIKVQFSREELINAAELLKIPRINSKNIKSIITNVENLCELCNLSEERINEIIENSKNAKLIYEFFNTTKKDSSLLNELDFEDLKDFYEESAKMQTLTASKAKKKTFVKTSSKTTTSTAKKATKSKKTK
jgi:hypothetical protein